MVKLTDKVFHCYSLGKQRNLDAIEIARIGRGISHEQLEREPSLFSIVNTNSPLKLDVPMMEGIIQMSSQGQLVIVTPFMGLLFDMQPASIGLLTASLLIGTPILSLLGGLGAALALGLRNSTVLIFMLVFGHIITKNKTQCLSLVI